MVLAAGSMAGSATVVDLLGGTTPAADVAIDRTAIGALKAGRAAAKRREVFRRADMLAEWSCRLLIQLKLDEVGVVDEYQSP